MSHWPGVNFCQFQFIKKAIDRFRWHLIWHKNTLLRSVHSTLTLFCARYHLLSRSYHGELKPIVWPEHLSRNGGVGLCVIFSKPGWLADRVVHRARINDCTASGRWVCYISHHQYWGVWAASAGVFQLVLLHDWGSLTNLALGFFSLLDFDCRMGQPAK